MSEKLFFFDCETTGVKHWKNSMHQLAGAIVIDGIVKERFDFKMRPHPSAIIEDEALVIGHVTREQILAYPEMRTTYLQILKMLGKYIKKFDKKDKFHMVGYNNSAFDNHFLRAFFVQNGDNYFGSWFWVDTLDCFILASKHLMHVRTELENFQQGTVAKYLNIEVDETKLHDAAYDTDILMQIWDEVK